MLLIRHLCPAALCGLGALSACSSPASPGGSGGASGTDSGPLVVSAIEYDDLTQAFMVLEDGDTVQLVRPPQGGHVIFVGARIENLDSDTIELTGRVRDATTHSIIQQDTRTVITEPVPGEPGLRQSDHRSFSQVANIALCPDYDPTSIAGESVVLEIEVTELYAQESTGSTTLHVVPACSQVDAAEKALCDCECAENYTLGKCSSGGPTNDAGP